MPEYLSIKPPHIHGNDQVCLNQLSLFLSFSLLGLTHLSSHINPLHVVVQCSVALVLCYHDSYVMVGLVSAFYYWVCLIRHFVIMRMLITCCHGEVTCSGDPGFLGGLWYTLVSEACAKF